MSRLYTRILLSFWAVMICVVLGAVGLTWIVLLERAEDLGRAPAKLSAEATQALSDGGEPGLTAWLTRTVAAQGDLHVYVLGPSGVDLLGRPMPPAVERALQRRSDGEAPPPPPPNAPLAARLLPPRPVPVLVAANGSEYLLVAVPHHHVAGPFDQPWPRAGYLLVALFVTGVASFWLARSISRPVRAISATTRSLASGALSARVEESVSSRRDEFGDLARDFDAMATRLQEQVDARERLLQDVSHELRSPLARMRVALGLARQAGGDVSTQLDRLEHEAERLNAMIGQVLALSRLGQQERPAAPTPLDLGDLVDDIARDAAFEGQARRITVEWHAPALAVTVVGDPVLLASAVENVVRNALRYTPDGSRVAIALESVDAPSGPAARITVCDEGPGVPDPELTRIFAPFHRVAPARGRDSGGDGLGLAITDRVLRAHRGTARAENRPGGGLKVILELPRQG